VNHKRRNEEKDQGTKTKEKLLTSFSLNPNPLLGFGSDCSERMKREAQGEFLQ